MSEHEDTFARVVTRTLDELPELFQLALENVVVLVEDVNEGEPDLYGLYDGVPLVERMAGHDDMRGPDYVYVYRRPLIDDFAHDLARLEAEIRVTLLHELAHHFGLDERRLEELGWA